MRRTIVLIASFALLAGIAPAWSQNPAQIAEWTEQLAKPEHEKRIDAARVLARLPSLPESAIRPIIDYLRLEATEVTERGAGRRVDGPGVIPVVGDEVSRARIEEYPASYVDRIFVLSGWLTTLERQIRSYTHGFANAKNTHYAFEVNLIGVDGRMSSEHVKVYLPRCIGTVLTEQQGVRVRLRCIIHSANTANIVIPGGYNAQAAHRVFSVGVLGNIEVIDWQILSADGKKWMPWTLEGISLGYRLLTRVVNSSHPTALDFIIDEAVPQDTKTDALLRESALLFLMNAPAKDRRLATRLILGKAKRITSPLAKKWAVRAYDSLMAGRLAE